MLKFVIARLAVRQVVAIANDKINKFIFLATTNKNLNVVKIFNFLIYNFKKFFKGQKMKFKVNNINCENCARSIKNGLEEDYGEIVVSVADKTVEVNLNEENAEAFKNDLSDLGFEVVAKID